MGPHHMRFLKVLLFWDRWGSTAYYLTRKDLKECHLSQAAPSVLPWLLEPDLSQISELSYCYDNWLHGDSPRE